MRIKFGALIVDGRGKLGGHVVSKSKQGFYLKTNIFKQNNPTQLQTKQREQTNTITQQWRALTQTQRQYFLDHANTWPIKNTFGETIYLSGFNLFRKLNLLRLSAGYFGLNLSPVKIEMPNAPIDSVSINTNENTIEIVGRASTSSVRMVIYATNKIPNGVTFVEKKVSILYTQVPSEDQENTIYTRYKNKYGTPLVGDNIFFGIKYTSPSGQSTPLQIIKATIT